MDHVLNNPIYNALISGNKIFARGDERVKFFPEDISPFAGLPENSQPDLHVLYQISPAKSFFILFTVQEMEIPVKWKVMAQMNILQMVRNNPVPLAEADEELIVLQEEHVPEMMALTKMTNPGPFVSGTIRFGHYMGIFKEGRLVAMAGQRLHPNPFVEISAVCTHPDHVGKGYAGILVNDQIKRILAGSETPFLHVLEVNERAINLYQKLGFVIRKRVIGYGLQKQDDHIHPERYA